MMKNNKGLTMIELLATILILGILTGLAFNTYLKYIAKTREKAYDFLIESSISATEAYLMDHQNVTKVNFDTLVNNGYLESSRDPGDEENNCIGTVKIIKQTFTDDRLLDKNDVVVDLCCKNVNYQYNSSTDQKVKTADCQAERNSEDYTG